MAGTIRAFLAVPLPDETREAVSRLIDRVRPALPGGRFVGRHALHLTLHFFEAIDTGQVAAVIEAARAAAQVTRAFQVTLRGAGAFPEERRPKVLWLGLAEGGDRLSSLTAAMGRGLSAAGLPVERRPFRPHLTLARFRDPSQPGLAQVLRQIRDAPAITFTADRVVLFRSDLTPAGAVHTVIEEFMAGP